MNNLEQLINNQVQYELAKCTAFENVFIVLTAGSVVISAIGWILHWKKRSWSTTYDLIGWLGLSLALMFSFGIYANHWDKNHAEMKVRADMSSYKTINLIK